MTKIHYFVSMLSVALLGASAATVVAQSDPSDYPKGDCVSTIDYDAMSQEELDDFERLHRH